MEYQGISRISGGISMPIHAILNCGTTLTVQGFGKRISLRKENFRDQDKPFRGSEDMQEITVPELPPPDVSYFLSTFLTSSQSS